MDQNIKEKVIIETKTTNKGKFLFYLLLIIAYLSGIGFVLLNKPKDKSVLQTPSEVSVTIAPSITASIYEPQPPSRAMQGTLKVNSKIVEKIPRLKDEWEEVATSSSILQEEKIQTDESGKAEVEFPNYLKVSINPLSSLYFKNLIPDSFLVEQSKGTAKYLIEKPISIRSIDTLTSIESGELTLEINPLNGFITMDIASGSAKFSFIDSENETQVYDINPGDRVSYDPETMTVSLK